MGIIHVWNSTEARPFKAECDQLTDTPVFMDQDHHEIHDEKTWWVEDTTADIGAEAGDFISLQFTTPAAATGLVHAVFDGYCAGAFTMDLREGQTGGGAGGAAVTMYNRYRNTSNTAPFSVTKDDTVGTGGSVLYTDYFGAGAGPFATGGLIRGVGEWVLKPATIYQVRVYNTGANAAYVRMHFYIEVPKHGA